MKPKYVHILNITDKLACINTSEGEFAVLVANASRRLERNTDNFLLNQSLREQVVGHSWDRITRVWVQRA